MSLPLCAQKLEAPTRSGLVKEGARGRKQNAGPQREQPGAGTLAPVGGLCARVVLLRSPILTDCETTFPLVGHNCEKNFAAKKVKYPSLPH